MNEYNTKEQFPFTYVIQGNEDDKYIRITRFEECKPALKNVVIPSYINGVPVKILGESLFKATDIESVSIPNTVVEIHPFCFEECNNLREINFPDSVRYIFKEVCYNCHELESVKWSKSATTIFDSTFYGCQNLKRISNIESVKSINARAFCNTGFTTFAVPAKCINIEANAFSQCDNLKVFKVGPSVDFINQSVFHFSPNVSLDCCKNSKIKQWAIDHELPIYETQIDTFLNDIESKSINKEKDW